MKVRFIDGTCTGDMTMCSISIKNVRGIPSWHYFVCGSCRDSDDTFNKQIKKDIVIVKQKSKLLTIFILFHELLHYITIKIFGEDSRIHNWIDKYI